MKINLRITKIKKFNTKLLVTGNHLLKSYGNTQKEIKKYLKNVIFIKTINIKKNSKFKFNFNSQKLLNILKKKTLTYAY